jgi:ribosomal-protein-alanine N-acetyltransferase
MNIQLMKSDPEFAELFLEWRQEAEMKKYNPLLVSPVDSLRERLQKASSDFSEFYTAETYFWFVEFESKKVGHLSLGNINQKMLTAEIGYGVSSQVRSKGIASRALRMISEEAFAKTPLRKLIAFVHEDNISSIRVLDKVGFVREGKLRDHYLINGEPATELIYGLLRDDLPTSADRKLFLSDN